MLTWTNICEHFSQSESQRQWTTIAGAGGTGTRRSRERAGLEHAGRGSGRDWNSQVAGAGGFKKTVPRTTLMNRRNSDLNH